MHGSSRDTFDLDICPAQDQANLDALGRALVRVGAQLRGAPATSARSTGSWADARHPLRGHRRADAPGRVAAVRAASPAGRPHGDRLGIGADRVGGRSDRDEARRRPDEGSGRRGGAGSDQAPRAAPAAGRSALAGSPSTNSVKARGSRSGAPCPNSTSFGSSGASRFAERRLRLGVVREERLRLVQPGQAGDHVHVVEHVAEDQHAVGLAPVGHVAGRVARHVEHLEAGHLVALAQAAVDGLARARPEALGRRLRRWSGWLLADQLRVLGQRRRRARRPRTGCRASRRPRALAPW